MAPAGGVRLFFAPAEGSFAGRDRRKHDCDCGGGYRPGSERSDRPAAHTWWWHWLCGGGYIARSVRVWTLGVWIVTVVFTVVLRFIGSCERDRYSDKPNSKRRSRIITAGKLPSYRRRRTERTASEDPLTTAWDIRAPDNLICCPKQNRPAWELLELFWGVNSS